VFSVRYARRSKKQLSIEYPPYSLQASGIERLRDIESNIPAHDTSMMVYCKSVVKIHRNIVVCVTTFSLFLEDIREFNV